MGKSATAEKFRTLRVPVFDSDACVHHLIGPSGPAFNPIIKKFPDTHQNGVIDRHKLGAAVFDNDPALKQLEAIVHPLVRAAQIDFVKKSLCRGAKSVLLDIPLLYETGAEKRCDVVIVVSAPPSIQRQRVMARPGMTAEKFKAILARQTPDTIKRQRADFVIDTGIGHRTALDQIVKILADLKDRSGARWPPGRPASKRFDGYGNLIKNLKRLKQQDKYHA